MTVITARSTALALSRAKNSQGTVVGISKASLAGEFAIFSGVIGVDALGEPNGAVNEDARYTINPRSMVYTEYDAVLDAPEKIPDRLNSVGITAIMDAMAIPEGLPIWTSSWLPTISPHTSRSPNFMIPATRSPRRTGGLRRSRLSCRGSPNQVCKQFAVTRRFHQVVLPTASSKPIRWLFRPLSQRGRTESVSATHFQPGGFRTRDRHRLCGHGIACLY